MLKLLVVSLACLAILVPSCTGDAQRDQADGGRRRIVRVRARPRNPDRQRAIRTRPVSSAPGHKSSGDCPEPEGIQVYPDPTSCNNFWKCTNGTLTYETCENGLLFDPRTALAGAAHHHCAYNWAVDCGDRPVDETAISSPGCPYRYGIFPIDKCQPSYYKCAEGKPTVTPCDVGLVFDERLHSCNWPDQQVDIGCDPSALLGGFVCPSLDELSPQAQRFAPFPRFAVEGQPRLYIICVNDQPRLQACGPGASFDPDTLGCVEQFLL